MRTRALLLLSMARAATLAPRLSRRVAVIGGGSAGVVAARFLRRAGHAPTLYEAGDGFGGVWAEQPTNGVVYKNLRTNLPTVVMQSPDLDFPAGGPSYVDKKALGDYIAAYAHHFGVAEVARFGCRVTAVDPLEGGRWRVVSSDGAEDYDCVVVANGHYEEPYEPDLPGQAEWLAGDASRKLTHSRLYHDPEEFAGASVLVVGGRSSGVDIARELNGVAAWTYVLEKKCAAAAALEAQRVTHLPLGARLAADGHVYVGDARAPGPPVDRVVLATGYVYAFPFLDEAKVGMRFRGRRSVEPLFLHLQHVERPTLGFVGVQLAVPCPIPFFEAQALYLAEEWAAPGGIAAVEDKRRWLAERLEEVASWGRPQDLHYTSSFGDSAWAYMRDLALRARPRDARAPEPPSWLDDLAGADARLATVESVYRDRAARYPTKPWHGDEYRDVEYSVDWAAGTWSSKDPHASSYCAQS